MGKRGLSSAGLITRSTRGEMMVRWLLTPRIWYKAHFRLSDNREFHLAQTNRSSHFNYAGRRQTDGTGQCCAVTARGPGWPEEAVVIGSGELLRSPPKAEGAELLA